MAQHTGNPLMRARTRLLGTAIFGLIAALVFAARSHSILTAALAGWAIAALAWAAITWRLLMPLDGPTTQAHVDGADPGTTGDDLIVMLASAMAVVGVGALLITDRSHPELALRNAGISVAAVLGSWFAVHLTYALRYTRAFYAEPTQRPIEFVGSGDQPPFSDFAYLALDLGMTFQVSDTTTRSAQIRRIITGHTLLSYALATIVIASTINAVLALAS